MQIYKKRVAWYNFKSIWISSTVLVEYSCEQRFSHHNTMTTPFFCYLQANFRSIGRSTKHGGKYILCNIKSESKEHFVKAHKMFLCYLARTLCELKWCIIIYQQTCALLMLRRGPTMFALLGQPEETARHFITFHCSNLNFLAPKTVIIAIYVFKFPVEGNTRQWFFPLQCIKYLRLFFSIKYLKLKAAALKHWNIETLKHCQFWLTMFSNHDRLPGHIRPA